MPTCSAHYLPYVKLFCSGNCFGAGKIYYSRHARDEMENDEFGEILDQEVYEAVLSGKVIEDYPDDFPYPSCLGTGTK